MMPSFEFISPAANAVASGPGEGEHAPQVSPGIPGEPFDDLMERALSPNSQKFDSSGKTKFENVSSDKGPRRFQAQVVGTANSGNSTAKTIKQTSLTKEDKSKTSSSEKGGGKTDKKNSTASEADHKIIAATTVLQSAAVQLIAPAANTPPPPETGKKSETANEGQVVAVSGKQVKGKVTKNVLAGNANMTINLAKKGQEAVKAVFAEDAAISGASSSEEENPVEAPATEDAKGHSEKTNASPLSSKVPVSQISSDKMDSQLATKSGTGEAQKIASAIGNLAAGKTNSGGTTSSDSLTTEKKLPASSGTISSVATDSFREIAAKPVQTKGLVQLGETVKTPSDNSGIPVAKLDTTMKNAEKTNKFAGSVEKILPGSTILSASKNNLPGRLDVTNPPRDKQSDLIVNSASAPLDSKTPAATAITTAATPAPNPGARILEHTHDMVVLHATRLQDSNSDSLRVVIKPDAGTQLSLELRQRGDSVDAHAILQRGDFNQLSQHWPELQQRLEQRGIRLVPLVSQQNTASNGGHSGFQQHQQPASHDSLQTGALTEFTFNTPTTQSFEPVVTPATTHRGWESWA